MSSSAIHRGFEVAAANDAVRFSRGEIEPLKVAGMGAYLKSMTPALWQAIGPTIEAITPLLTKNEVDDTGYDDYEMA